MELLKLPTLMSHVLSAEIKAPKPFTNFDYQKMFIKLFFAFSLIPINYHSHFQRYYASAPMKSKQREVSYQSCVVNPDTGVKSELRNPSVIGRCDRKFDWFNSLRSLQPSTIPDWKQNYQQTFFSYVSIRKLTRFLVQLGTQEFLWSCWCILLCKWSTCKPSAGHGILKTIS